MQLQGERSTGGPKSFFPSREKGTEKTSIRGPWRGRRSRVHRSIELFEFLEGLFGFLEIGFEFECRPIGNTSLVEVSQLLLCHANAP